MALIGGMLIGLSATILLAFDGRIAGISGIVNGAMKLGIGESWRWFFIMGVLICSLLYKYFLFPETTLSPSFLVRLVFL